MKLCTILGSLVLIGTIGSHIMKVLEILKWCTPNMLISWAWVKIKNVRIMTCKHTLPQELRRACLFSRKLSFISRLLARSINGLQTPVLRFGDETIELLHHLCKFTGCKPNRQYIMMCKYSNFSLTKNVFLI